MLVPRRVYISPPKNGVVGMWNVLNKTGPLSGDMSIVREGRSGTIVKHTFHQSPTGPSNNRKAAAKVWHFLVVSYILSYTALYTTHNMYIYIERERELDFSGKEISGGLNMSYIINIEIQDLRYIHGILTYLLYTVINIERSCRQ